MWLIAAGMAALVSGRTAIASESYFDPEPPVAAAAPAPVAGTCDECDLGFDDCCGGGGLVFQAEALFFKYFRADGVRAGAFSTNPPATTDDISFDYVATPRITLGWVTDSGLGARIRYWEFAQAGTAVFPATGVSMGADPYTFDMELFEMIQLNDVWAVELSGGIRYNEFSENMLDPIPTAARLNTFHGFGGILGMEAIRSLGRFGGVYFRARGSILHDDRTVTNIGTGLTENALINDSTVGTTELALGWEYARFLQSGALFRFRTGYEWQNWYNYSSAFTPVTTAPGNAPASFAGTSDVGFSGFTLSLGLER